jgi:predicted aldo/keto reductase-like oxidoreductase
MDQYAQVTSGGYCTGCAEICEKAIANEVPISDIMRYFMYYENYGDQQQAIRLFNDLPPDTRKRILRIDYSEAERCCPQNMPIAQLMQKAVASLECKA